MQTKLNYQGYKLNYHFQSNLINQTQALTNSTYKHKYKQNLSQADSQTSYTNSQSHQNPNTPSDTLTLINKTNQQIYNSCIGIFQIQKIYQITLQRNLFMFFLRVFSSLHLR